jgi:hypothetical protein
MTKIAEWRFNFWGWVLFTFSAAGFTLGALRSGDALSLIASLLFLLACFLFLAPVWSRRPARK